MRSFGSGRAWVVGVAIVGALGTSVAAARGLGEGTVYYRSPGEVIGGESGDDVVRVGGTVLPGSIRFDRREGVLRFVLSDGRSELPVINRGAPPRLFRAGEEALVEGRVIAGALRSSQVIVKHDEDYREPQLEQPEARQ